MSVDEVVEHRLRIGDRDVVLLHGPAGWGEWSPLAGYPCDPAAAWRAAHEAAVDGFPPSVRDVVPVNALVPDAAPIDETLLARVRGLPCVKVKVGRRDPDADIERVAALRDALGPTIALRVDANGAWDLDAAVTVLTRLARYEIEFAEQPVASLDELAELRRRVPVRVAADECVRTVADARRLRVLGAADVIVLKVQPLGGVRPALAIAADAGVPAVVGSMLETSVGLAAGLALAAALPDLRFACGLATLDQIAGDVVREPLAPRDGRLHARGAAPEPDPALLARYALSEATS